MPVTATDLGALRDLVVERARGLDRPFVVAIDGRSGVGKSTLVAALASATGGVVIEGDDFYAGGTELRDDTPAERAAACIDWTRQRPVLQALREGREAVWRAFDWDAFDGRLCDAPARAAPAPVVVLEGVYAARPELADLVDLRVVVVASDATRLARLAAREGEIGPWERQWHEAEVAYFDAIAPVAGFDVVVDAT